MRPRPGDSEPENALLARSQIALRVKDRFRRATGFLTGRWSPHDLRGGKVVLVPHCVLNQNARVAGAAERPAAVDELVAGLIKRHIGILQMPCPELEAFGLDRSGIEIARELRTGSGRAICQRLVRELVRQIQEYRSCGVAVLGVLGKDGSPACGVEETWNDRACPGQGAFIEELAAALREGEIPVEMAGIRDTEPWEALEAVDRWSLDRAPARRKARFGTR